MTVPVGFVGVFPILPTPFHSDESIDLDSYRRMVSFMADIGVNGITILGVLGEANRLIDRERETIIGTAVKAASGRIPVIVGTSHSGTRATVELSRQAADLGASGIMVTPHRENVPQEQRIYDHFASVNEAVNLPIVLQDHPGSTEVHMSLELVLRMVAELDHIACVKQEALPSPARVSALISGMGTRKVPILTGLGALYGGFELANGGSGFMTGFAFPEVLLAMVRANAEADTDRLWRIYCHYLPLIVFEGQPGVAIRKHLFHLRGLLATDRVRGPAAGISANATTQLRTTLDRIVGDADITKKLEVP
jgi:4-hydroxy-tetrahydrodipicolinate synthase